MESKDYKNWTVKQLAEKKNDILVQIAGLSISDTMEDPGIIDYLHGLWKNVFELERLISEKMKGIEDS